MKWSPGCDCCDLCWECDFPLRLDITWVDALTTPSTPAEGRPKICDCALPDALLNNTNKTDGGLSTCYTKWEFSDACCNGSNEFEAVYWKIELWTDTGPINYRASIQHKRHWADITGGSCSNPCDKDWELFGSISDQTVDGCTLTNQRNLIATSDYDAAANFTCPASGANSLLGGGVSVGGNNPGMDHCVFPTSINMQMP